MKTIEVTVEVRRRLSKRIELTEEEYEAFLCGEIDELDISDIDLPGLFNECRCACDYSSDSAWEETDYAICDENGNTIVPWND